MTNVRDNSQPKETKFGRSLVGSFASYQLSHTESNFSVCIDISPVPRTLEKQQPLTYPRAPFRDLGDPMVPDNLEGPETSFNESISIDEETVNNIEHETRGQMNSEKWKNRPKYRFTFPYFSQTDES